MGDASLSELDMRLSDSAWIQLKDFARKLTATTSSVKSATIAQEALQCITGFLHQDDMKSLYELLRAEISGDPSGLFDLSDWYYTEEPEKDDSQFFANGYTQMVLQCLIDDPFNDPASLPRAVECAMQLGHMDDLEAFESIVESYIEKLFFVPTETTPGT